MAPADSKPGAVSEEDWRRGAVAALEALADDGIKVHVFYDDDGDPETLIYAAGNEPPGHGRVSFGNDSGRYAFWSYGWQGFGGGQFVVVGPVTVDALVTIGLEIKKLIRAEGLVVAASRAEVAELKRVLALPVCGWCGQAHCDRRPPRGHRGSDSAICRQCYELNFVESFTDDYHPQPYEQLEVIKP